jgi:hypothetical protein
MINITIAKASGTEMVSLMKDDIDRLNRAGFEDEDGNPLEADDLLVVWERMRGVPDDEADSDEYEPYKYGFEVDPNSSQTDSTKSKDDTIVEVLKTYAENPQLATALEMSGFRLDTGELFKQLLIDKIKDSEKIIVPIGDQQTSGAGQVPPQGMPPQALQPGMQAGGAEDPQAEVQAIMEQYELDPGTAATFAQLRRSNMNDEQIIAYLTQGVANAVA